MFKKVNWMLILGAAIIIFGAVNFGLDYKNNAASPFDIADAETGSDNFLPIILPDSSQGDGSNPAVMAPTVEASLQATPAPIVDIEGRVPDRIVIPAIFLDAPIIPVHYKDIQSGGETYHQWRVPAEFAVGWQDESALLGLPGNTVLNGHHNAYGMVFQNLVELKVGDVIEVYSAGWIYTYTVQAKLLLPERGQPLEVRQENARWIQPSTDERLTLVTCWPAESNTHRVIIVALPDGKGARQASASGN